MATFRTGAVRWTALFALYLVLAGSLASAELLTGLGTATLATGFSLLLRRVAARPFRVNAPWAQLAVTAGRSLLDGSVRVGIALARAVLACHSGHSGHVVRRDVVMHADDAAEQAGERAIGLLAASIAPDAYVLAMGRTRMRLHCFAAAASAHGSAWPA